MNKKKIGMVCSLFLLLFHFPFPVSGAEMESTVQLRFEGEVSAPTFPSPEPEKVFEAAGNAVGTIATGNLPQTGELQSLGLVLLGTSLVGWMLIFFYKKKKEKSATEPEVKE